MDKKKVYQAIASSFQAYQNCIKNKNFEWELNHAREIDKIVKQCFPQGSGIDNGINFDSENSTLNKLIFTFSYHYMNENGFYNGWYDYKLIVTPSLAFDIDIKIVGKDTPNQAKDYLYDIFQEALTAEIEG